ncbi:MAG: MFS transporter [Crocinitomicaceae bacterium]|nr:MFS transporter [Crocinitomicaceae bacterium]
MQKRLIPAYLLTFVNVLGFSILMPVLPFIVETYHAPEWVYGALLTFYSAFQFLGAPYLGAMSDQQGRKKVLIISQAGTLLSWLVFIVALALPDVPFLGLALPLWIIAVSRILDGITGGNTSVANAYVSDITSRTEKTYIFGYLGGIAGIGLIVGPGIGGLAASTSIGYTGTMIVASAISVITLVVLFLWLKESLPENKRRPVTRQRLFKSLFIMERIKKVNPPAIIRVIFWMKLLFHTMMTFYISTIALFLIDLFDFNEKELGFFMLVVGLFLSFNQAFLSRVFVKKLGAVNTLIIGLILAATGLFCITLTDNLWLYIMFYYVMNLGLSICFPTFNSLISIHADANKQGEIMGISESIRSMTMAAFPVLAAAIYGWIGYPVYYMIAALPLAALAIALKNIKILKPEHYTEELEVE